MREFFRHFGLTESEITVYLALTRLGGVKVSALAAATGFTRSACQEYIRSLEDNGFINSTKVGNKFLYQAEDPDMIRQMIVERIFLVDRLAPELSQREHREEWQARVISRPEGQQLIKRARKKGLEIIESGDSNIGGAVVDKKKVAIWSGDGEVPGVEMRSSALARIHLELFSKK